MHISFPSTVVVHIFQLGVVDAFEPPYDQGMDATTQHGNGEDPGEDGLAGLTPSSSTDALSAVAAHLTRIEASSEARAVLAQILTATFVAFSRTSSVRDALPDTAPDSPGEALAVLAGIDHLCASLAAMDAAWQVADRAEDPAQRCGARGGNRLAGQGRQPRDRPGPSSHPGRVLLLPRLRTAADPAHAAHDQRPLGRVRHGSSRPPRWRARSPPLRRPPVHVSTRSLPRPLRSCPERATEVARGHRRDDPEARAGDLASTGRARCARAARDDDSAGRRDGARFRRAARD